MINALQEVVCDGCKASKLVFDYGRATVDEIEKYGWRITYSDQGPRTLEGHYCENCDEDYRRRVVELRELKYKKERVRRGVWRAKVE